MAAAPRKVNLWGVPASVLVVGVGGSFVAFNAAAGATNGSFPAVPGVDPRLTLLLFAVPVSTAVTAAVAFFTGLRGGAARGPLLGTVAGLFAAAAMGFEYLTLASWWNQFVPTDTNRAAALIVAWIVAFLSVTVALMVVGLAGPVLRVRRRNRVLGLALLASVQGLLTGLFVGVAVAAVDAGLQTCSFCNGPDAVSAAESGAFVGSWVGALVGLAVGLAVAAIAVYALPPVPVAELTSDART